MKLLEPKVEFRAGDFTADIETDGGVPSYVIRRQSDKRRMTSTASKEYAFWWMRHHDNDGKQYGLINKSPGERIFLRIVLPGFMILTTVMVIFGIANNAMR